MSAQLARIERIIDAAGVAGRIEALLPVGVRPRQLSVRTLLIGLLLLAVDKRPALLTGAHQALLALPEADKWRLGVIVQWPDGPHRLTYRQLEYTFALLADKLSKAHPDGSPSERLSEVLDALLETSVTVLGEPASSSYAVDWTDLESWSCPPRTQRANPDNAAQASDESEQTPPEQDSQCADPEAAWGHRRGEGPGQRDEAFYGYYLQAATIVRDEHGPDVPELVRRIHLASCDHDPPPAFVPVLERMHQHGIPLGDLLADSGYSYRQSETFALPIRALGAQLIMDLHPNDRGPNGTHKGAILANGNLYCPATPHALLELGPLPRGATAEHTETHDRQCQELARYKLSPITAPDPDGYHRVICPAAQQKLRCPLRPQSLTLPHHHPQVLKAPEHPPVCCTQKTITVPPSVNAKTAQKHDFPSPQHRRSYNRRSAAERTYSTIKDPATNDLSRGWCRIMGLTGIALFTATTFIARNLRINDAFHTRQTDQQRRAANGLPPKQRKRRRHTADDLITTAKPP